MVRHVFVPGKIFADVNALCKAAVSCENKTACLWVSLVFIKITQPIKKSFKTQSCLVFRLNFESGHRMCYWDSFHHRQCADKY